MGEMGQQKPGSQEDAAGCYILRKSGSGRFGWRFVGQLGRVAFGEARRPSGCASLWAIPAFDL